MKHKEEFRAWLDKKDFKSTASYIAYLNSIEVVFDDVDKLLEDVVEAGIESKITEKRFNKSQKDVQNYKSALRKYWEFLNDKAK